jgi:hypothetical protein
MVLANRAIVVVMTPMMAVRFKTWNSVNRRTAGRFNDRCILRGPVLIVRLQPKVQPLAKYGDEAVTSQRQSGE